MSKPSMAAWKCLMHMLKWMGQNVNRGIKFSRDGNPNPVGFGDASNKPILSTGQCQGGWCIMWLDGPIASASVRLHHVGLSSEHNEYMALNLLIRKIVWLRQLLEELEMKLTEPTPVFGDNVQANRLCTEHFISPGNQYIATQYHFNKEKVQEGEVDIYWVVSKLNISDVFTKALDSQILEGLMPVLLGYGSGIINHMEMIREVTMLKESKR